MTRAPALVAASHGTSSPEGSAAVAALVDAVRRAAPGTRRRGRVRRRAAARRGLGARRARHRSRGRRRAAAALRRATTCTSTSPARSRGRDGAPVLGAALGPDDRLVEVLAARLVEAGLRGDDRVVLAAAGSSDAARRRRLPRPSRRLAGAARAAGARRLPLRGASERRRRRRAHEGDASGLAGRRRELPARARLLPRPRRGGRRARHDGADPASGCRAAGAARRPRARPLRRAPRSAALREHDRVAVGDRDRVLGVRPARAVDAAQRPAVGVGEDAVGRLRGTTARSR